MSIAYARKKKIFQEKYREKEGVNQDKVTARVRRGRGNPGKMHKTEGPDLTK